MPSSDASRRYWLRNRKLVGALLAVWFAVTFVIGWFARELNFSFFGWPFSFWIGAQGSLIVYVLLIWIHARGMKALDAEHDADQGD